MKRSLTGVSALILTALLFAGCGTKVTRIDPNATTDLSGRWNDTDSRLVAEEMINECLSQPWYGRYQGRAATPRVIVGEVRNMSHEHISVETFVNDMQRTLINSGKVEFVASKQERVQLREEKADQMGGNASEATVKMAGNEAGADIMLYGSINTIADQEGNKQAMYYQIDLQLVEIESNRKLWIGTKKIKKIITRSSATF
jgi:uncharacterized protein (TIGR02722 family)